MLQLKSLSNRYNLLCTLRVGNHNFLFCSIDILVLKKEYSWDLLAHHYTYLPLGFFHLLKVVIILFLLDIFKDEYEWSFYFSSLYLCYSYFHLGRLCVFHLKFIHCRQWMQLRNIVVQYDGWSVCLILQGCLWLFDVELFLLLYLLAEQWLKEQICVCCHTLAMVVLNY